MPEPDDGWVYGCQRLRIETVPPFVSSSGQEAAELAASAGLLLDPWQRNCLNVGLGENADGAWSAFEIAINDLGATTRLFAECRDPGGIPATAAAATVTVTLPDGTTATPVTAEVAPLGTYQADYVNTLPGQHTVRRVFTGPVHAYTDTSMSARLPRRLSCRSPMGKST
ncbi:hypothetical protein ACIRLA_33735 [Streptomyces sp. NPDC102364]|uniref:hypothetical protein n=1 Tax=Streptomyces sp. NPDC102364 TaxID=3366161 RepID=UPI0037F69712